MGADGHVRLNRWYNPGDDREDYYDLSEYQVYWDSITKQYKAKFNCANCWKDLGWYCYNVYQTGDMIHELLEGVDCVECFENDNIDFDFDPDECEEFTGKRCEC